MAVNGDWLPLSAGIYVEEQLKEQFSTPDYLKILGLVEAWDAYLHRGTKGLGDIRSRGAAEIVRGWIKYLEPHYGKRDWHEAQIRILRVLALELAFQIGGHIRKMRL
ncbi:MAG TPA: hypothetical protein VHC68_00770 [Candidatus Paceibacterota bacterium]|nr:hypothetical protein [Candidatus Paceibacterota bacterium]